MLFRVNISDTKLSLNIDAVLNVRLVGGKNEHEGRLEVWHDGSWGTVCDDEITALAAKVVCRMLNYPR
jgi:hypothetical protein